MKRMPQTELLDDDSGTPEEIDASFRDLRLVNRLFGGISTTKFLLQHAMSRAKLKNADVLEVAAGDGYAIRVAASSINHGNSINITALDRSEAHIANNGHLRFAIGDAMHLPFPENSFDFVSCALFLHHLSPDEVVKFVAGALRVCRHAVLINDLRRSPIHLGLIYLGMPLFRSRITRHDSVASVRQSYTPVEVRHMLASTPARRIEVEERYLYRMAALAWK